MEVGKLTVKRRNKTGKGVSRKLRSQGRLPGILYGSQMQPISVDFDGRTFRGSLDPARRQNTVLDLTIEDDGQPAQKLAVMVKDYQIHPIRREVTHVDFVAVDLTREVTVQVPLVFTGKAKGLTDGGVMHVVMHDLQIRCKPSDIPNQIELDIADMGVGDVLHVSDLKLPAGITASMPPRLTVITCAAPSGAGTAAETPAEGAEGAAAPAAEGAAS
ncbi:MAG TPA: 50S ribosomal protein L25/general stress protein Ctc [Haliangium sp.]|nr:50S ribosomal protein L25/general stress protein Ctc [Haliangium sp.]